MVWLLFEVVPGVKAQPIKPSCFDVRVAMLQPLLNERVVDIPAVEFITQSKSGSHFLSILSSTIERPRWATLRSVIEVSVFIILSAWLCYAHRRCNAVLENKARSEERRRLARELHDSLLQSLHGLTFRLQGARNLLPHYPAEAAQMLDSSLDLADRAIAEGREVIGNLRSSNNVYDDLESALMTVAEGLSVDGSRDITPNVRVLVKGQPRILSSQLSGEIYCIAREGLRNAFHHARAHTIILEIAYEQARLRLRIRDDGSGIAPSVVNGSKSNAHWGLCGMRERAQALGGQLEIRSSQDYGTEIEVVVRDLLAS